MENGANNPNIGLFVQMYPWRTPLLLLFLCDIISSARDSSANVPTYWRISCDVAVKDKVLWVIRQWAVAVVEAIEGAVEIC
ncbi:hypothetical protein HBI60_100060 [Parastagonospora nodorum]|nr:hypothetical protein HBI79_121760 [Parastagonospora nodorum]KAH5694006.1 hypothetical protein HBI44_141140 [Parastagonospora nodorum]KAH6398691.1 hypothetical protein HBI60_100060 [Parastagonospora nodorum]